jgi:hypothetical protein
MRLQPRIYTVRGVRTLSQQPNGDFGEFSQRHFVANLFDGSTATFTLCCSCLRTSTNLAEEKEGEKVEEANVRTPKKTDEDLGTL